MSDYIGYGTRADRERLYGRAWTAREFCLHVLSHLNEHGNRALFTRSQVDRIESEAGVKIRVEDEVLGVVTFYRIHPKDQLVAIDAVRAAARREREEARGVAAK